MKSSHLNEPELEFGGGGRHLDIRFGIMDHGPFDIESEQAPRRIQVGVVGTAATVEGVQEWLSKCSVGIPAKQSKLGHLFPRFPGHGADAGFRAEAITSVRTQRTILDSALDEAWVADDYAMTIRNLVQLFEEAIRFVAEETGADVLVCAVPLVVAKLMDPAQRPPLKAGDPLLDFHDMLKARSLEFRKPIQLVLPSTYDPSQKVRVKRGGAGRTDLQDEATRAWNFFAALYYKAGGLPWRIPRAPEKFTTCYVGIGFYKSLDGAQLTTAMAQVFDERGDGTIVKGGPVSLSKEDRTPHLTADDIGILVQEGIKRYREVHATQPARVVVHKTSAFDPAELEGCKAQLRHQGIEHWDLFSMTRNDGLRLFRDGDYPPLRGTLLSLDDKSHVLYTRGSVDFYQTYPGLYVPRGLFFRTEETQSTPRELAQEILALSKMNWNKTQFDGALPITLEAARKVGDVLKYVDHLHPRMSHYRFFM